MYGVIRSLHMYIDTVWTVVVKYDFFKFKIVTKLTNGDIAKGPWDTEIEPSLIFMFLFYFVCCLSCFLCVLHLWDRSMQEPRRGATCIQGAGSPIEHWRAPFIPFACLPPSRRCSSAHPQRQRQYNVGRKHWMAALLLSNSGSESRRPNR